MLALDPAAVVLLIGTNDLEEGADSGDRSRATSKLILADLERHNARLPIVLCQVFPSSATQKRPADKIKALNALYLAAVKNDPQVTYLETWPLFAGPDGDATPAEFPDLLHPNETGYAKWAAALRPVFATLGFAETTRGSVHARGRLREPLQRPRPHRLGLSTDLGEGQGERRALAGLGPERRRLADRHAAGRASTA